MTIVRLADRLARLEQRRNPPPDFRAAAEARAQAIAAIDELVSTLDPGAADFDLIEALDEVIEQRRRDEGRRLGP